MKAFFKRLATDESGLTLPEYGIGLALAVVLGVGAMSGLATNIGDSMTRAGGCMPPATGAVPTTC